MNIKFKLKAIALMLVIASAFSIPQIGMSLLVAIIIGMILKDPFLKFFGRTLDQRLFKKPDFFQNQNIPKRTIAKMKVGLF